MAKKEDQTLDFYTLSGDLVLESPYTDIHAQFTQRWKDNDAIILIQGELKGLIRLRYLQTKYRRMPYHPPQFLTVKHAYQYSHTGMPIFYVKNAEGQTYFVNAEGVAYCEE